MALPTLECAVVEMNAALANESAALDELPPGSLRTIW